MTFRKSVGRAVGVMILALTPWILLAIGVRAQAPPNLPPPGAYQPIPNFTGVGAGVQFRQAINDRLSGLQPIAPAVVKLAFANLPTEQDGALIYCTNCTRTIPCASGGSGAWASGQNGIWACGSAGLSPSADINFNAHKASNLGSATVNGDALAFGQNGAQLGAYLQPFIRSGTTSCAISGTSCVMNRPANVAAGDLLLTCGGIHNASAAVTQPSSFTQVRLDQGQGWTHSCASKVATISEPSTYTVGYSVSDVGTSTMMDLGQAGVIDGSSGNTYSSSLTASQTAPSTTTPKDLMVVCAEQIYPTTLTAPTPNSPQPAAVFGNEACWSYTGAPATASLSSGTNFPWAVAQIAIKPTVVAGSPALSDQLMTFASLVATGTPNYSLAAGALTGFGVDGCFNPLNYGADPTGLADNSAAFTAASNAACAAFNPINGIAGLGSVCIPAGDYLFLAPWLHFCTSGGLTPDIGGAGKDQTILVNAIGGNSGAGGPLLEIASSLSVSSFGGSSGLIKPGLTASGGNSWNSGTNNAIFNLDQALDNRKLNGKSALTIRAIFNTTTNAATEYLVASDGSASPLKTGCNFVSGDGSYTCKSIGLFLGSEGKIYCHNNTSVTGWKELHSASAVGTGTNIYGECSYDGSNTRLFHGALGGTSTMDAKVAQTGTIVQRPDENLMMLGGGIDGWSMFGPKYFWQGQVDSVEIASAARCTNDSGCAIPNAKIAGDSSTIFLENWSNVSRLPLVEPEYANGQATDNATRQVWMAMYNEGVGNSGANNPTIHDLGIVGGTVGIHENVVSPHYYRVNLNLGSATPHYGIMADISNDYGTQIYDSEISSLVLPFNLVGGLGTVSGSGAACGVACGETNGGSVFNTIFQPSAGQVFGLVVGSQAHLDDVIWDTESGGTAPALQISQLNPSGFTPLVEISSSDIVNSGAVAPIVIDGAYLGLRITNTVIQHQGFTGPMVDLTSARQGTGSTGITFDNDIYENSSEPSDTAGDSYASLTDQAGSVVRYTVVGGGSTRQTTLTGTSAGTFVWSMPQEGSGYKRFVGHYTGYENTTATAQTISYPVAFALPPKITTNDGPSGSTGTSVLTLPASMGSAVTGWIIVEGY